MDFFFFQMRSNRTNMKSNLLHCWLSRAPRVLALLKFRERVLAGLLLFLFFSIVSMLSQVTEQDREAKKQGKREVF